MKIENHTAIKTIAYKVVQEACKNKTNFLVLILLNLFLICFPFLLKSDGTLVGKIQIFLNYGLLLTSAVLYLCTLFFTSSSLASEIKQKQIYLIDVKPVQRHEFIIGKFLGVALLNLIFLSITGTVLLGTIEVLKTTAKSQEDVKEIQEKFLRVYQSKTPFINTVQQQMQMEKEFERLQKLGQLPNEPEPLIKEKILEEIQELSRLVPAGMVKEWTFYNIPETLIQEDKNLILKYKIFTSVGNPDKILKTTWQIGRGSNRFIYESETQVGEMVSFSFPSYTIEKNGTLFIRFTHRNNSDGMIYFPKNEGITIYYPVGNFYINYAKTLACIYLMSCFIITLCLFGCTFLNFPVAVFLTLVVLFIASMAGFLQELIPMAKNLTQEKTIIESIFLVLSDISLKISLALIPTFTGCVPLDNLFTGMNISIDYMIKNLLYLGIFRICSFLFLSCLIFSYRELGRPIDK